MAVGENDLYGVGETEPKDVKGVLVDCAGGRSHASQRHRGVLVIPGVNAPAASADANARIVRRP